MLYRLIIPNDAIPLVMLKFRFLSCLCYTFWVTAFFAMLYFWVLLSSVATQLNLSYNFSSSLSRVSWRCYTGVSPGKQCYTVEYRYLPCSVRHSVLRGCVSTHSYFYYYCYYLRLCSPWFVGITDSLLYQKVLFISQNNSFTHQAFSVALSNFETYDSYFFFPSLSSNDSPTHLIYFRLFFFWNISEILDFSILTFSLVGKFSVIHLI